MNGSDLVPAPDTIWTLDFRFIDGQTPDAADGWL